jgi:integrase
MAGACCSGSVTVRLATRLLADQRERVETLQRQLGRIIADVFVHTGKGPLQGQRVREFNKAWRPACDEAGYTGVLLHDLRRSGVRAMVRSGTPESVCMKISGHSTGRGFQKVRHHERSRFEGCA